MQVGDVFYSPGVEKLQVVYVLDGDNAAVLTLTRKHLVEWASTPEHERVDHEQQLVAIPVRTLGLQQGADLEEARIARRYVFGEPTLIIRGLPQPVGASS